MYGHLEKHLLNGIHGQHLRKHLLNGIEQRVMDADIKRDPKMCN